MEVVWAEVEEYVCLVKVYEARLKGLLNSASQCHEDSFQNISTCD